jgi:hypothetical protein
MAELKPIKITIDGVEKVLKSTQQIQKEIKEVQALYKQKNKIELSDKEALAVLRNIKKEATETENSLNSIDKNFKFSNFKAAAKTISTELVNIAAVAATSGKSTSENIQAIGGSIAGIASQFGFVGAAAGALITVLTPVIASLFEASEAEKALTAASEEYSKIVAEQTVVVNDSFEVLKDNTATYIEKKEAIEELQKILPQYLENVNLEGASLEKLNELQKISIALVRKLALEKIFGEKIAEQQAKRLEAEIKAEARFAKIRRDRIADGKTEAEADAIVSKVRLSGATVQYEEYLDIVEETSEAISILEATQKSLNDQLSKSLTKEEADALALLEKNANKAAKTLDKNKADSGTKTQKPKNVSVFGASVEDLLKELETGNLTAEETEVYFNAAIKAANEYAKTLDNVSDKVLKASGEIEKLNKENTDLFKSRSEIEAQANKSTDLLNVESLKKNVDSSKKLLEDFTNEYNAVVKSITDGSGNFDALVLAFEDKYKVFYSGSIDDVFVNDAKKNIKTYEDAYKKALEQEVMLKQTSAAAILDIDEKLSENKKKLVQNQRLLDAADANQSVKIIQENQKRIENIQKNIAEKSTKAFEDAIAAEIAARDGATKAEITANLANLKTYTDLITQNTQVAISNVRKSIQPTLDAFNTEFKGAFTLDDDIIVTNQKIEDEIFKNATNEQIQRFLVVKSAANSANKEIRAINAKSRSEISNAQINFAETYIQNYRTLNETDLRFQEVKSREVLAQTEDGLKKTTEYIKNNVEERRKLGEKQSDEELRIILNSNRSAIEYNTNKYDALLNLQFLESGKAIDELKRKGIDTELLERESALKVENILREKYKNEADLQKFFNDLLDKNQKKQNAKTEKNLSKSFISLAKELQTFGNLLIDLLNQNNQNIIDNLNEDLNLLELRSTDLLSSISSLEDDLEGKRSGRRDAVLQSLEQQKELEKDLAKEKIRLAKQIEAEEVKLRKRQQAAAIANAVINGALAVTNILAQPSVIPEPANTIFKGVQIGIAAATTAAQIALISSQKFAKGGYTGNGGEIDETGHRVAGIVHDGEWVAPKWLVESPKFNGVINQLENARVKGFADGGFTSPNFNSLSQSVTTNSTAKLESMLKSYTDAAIALSNRPIYTSVTEVQNVSTNANRRKNQATL